MAKYFEVGRCHEVCWGMQAVEQLLHFRQEVLFKKVKVSGVLRDCSTPWVIRLPSSGSRLQVFLLSLQVFLQPLSVMVDLPRGQGREFASHV